MIFFLLFYITAAS